MITGKCSSDWHDKCKGKSMGNNCNCECHKKGQMNLQMSQIERY